MGPKDWIEFSKDYDSKVYSLTKVPKHREEVCKNLLPGYTLNVGTGSMPYMNQHLIQRRHSVLATDFCEDMLNEAKKQFSHSRLKYMLADTRQLPFARNSFDNIVSMNSILPEERTDVLRMFESIYSTLGVGGTFAAFLPSFDCGQKFASKIDIKIDEENLREYDTSGWQSFHTPESIQRELGQFDWRSLDVKKIFLDAPEDIEQLKRLYGVDTTNNPIWEYLVVARK